MNRYEEALATWLGLNAELVNADKAFCEKLLAMELIGAKRMQVVLRIHGRLNRVRAAMERVELRRQVHG